jgi:hypothetical protein
MTVSKNKMLEDMATALIAIDKAREHFHKLGVPRSATAVLDDAITRINEVVKTSSEKRKTK